MAICLDGTPAGADAVTGPRHPEMCSCAAAAHFCLVAQAHPAVVPHARRSARHTLAAWRLDQIADDTELVVSELLTNAVQATLAASTAAPRQWPTPPMVALYLTLDPDLLSVLVWDNSPEPPAPRPSASDEDENGRVLIIVQALSDQWGICAPPGGGKVVWAQLSSPSPGRR